eukprot:g474.t1
MIQEDDSISSAAPDPPIRTVRYSDVEDRDGARRRVFAPVATKEDGEDDYGDRSDANSPMSIPRCRNDSSASSISTRATAESKLCSSTRVRLATSYFQGLVSVQFSSGWRKYWAVLDGVMLYLCDEPNMTPKASSRITLYLTTKSRIQSYENEGSKRHNFCFILFPTNSSDTARDNFHSIWRFSRESDRKIWRHSIEGNILRLQKRSNASFFIDAWIKSSKCLSEVENVLRKTSASNRNKDLTGLLRSLFQHLRTDEYTQVDAASTNKLAPFLTAGSSPKNTWNYLSKTDPFPDIRQFEILIRGKNWPHARDAANLSDAAPDSPRTPDSASSPRESFSSKDDDGSTVEKLDDMAEEWTPSTRSARCHVAMTIGEIDRETQEWRPKSDRVRQRRWITWFSEMSREPSFPSAMMFQIDVAEIADAVLRFEFTCENGDGNKKYVVSRFDVHAIRLLTLRTGTEVELTSDYHPGRLLIHLRRPSFTSFDLVHTMRPMAQTYRFLNMEKEDGGLLVREEASEPHFTYLLPLKFMELRHTEMMRRIKTEKAAFEALPESKRKIRHEWHTKFVSQMESLAKHMAESASDYLEHFKTKVAFRGSSQKKGPDASRLAYVPLNLHVQSLTMVNLDKDARWARPMDQGERLSMLTWGSTAAHCEKFKNGAGLTKDWEKLYKIEHERLKLCQELSDLEEQVKEDTLDKDELEGQYKIWDEKLTKQEMEVSALQERVSKEAVENEETNKASKDAIDALKEATRVHREYKDHCRDLMDDIRNVNKRMDKFGGRVATLIEDSEDLLRKREVLKVKIQSRTDMVMSCALTGMTTAFAVHVENLLAVGDMCALENLVHLGFLVEQESLLSTYSKENGMLQDQYAGSLMLNKVAFRVERDPNWNNDWERMHSADTGDVHDQSTPTARLSLIKAAGAVTGASSKSSSARSHEAQDCPSEEKLLSEYSLRSAERRRMQFLLSRVRVERESKPLDVSVSSDMQASFRNNGTDLRWASIKSNFGHPGYAPTPKPKRGRNKVGNFSKSATSSSTKRVEVSKEDESARAATSPSSSAPTAPPRTISSNASTEGAPNIPVLMVPDDEAVKRIDTVFVKTPTPRLAKARQSTKLEHGVKAAETVDDENVGYLIDGSTVKGWLWKEGKSTRLFGLLGKPWQKRWFVLRKGRISWFSQKNVESEQNSLLLDGYKVSEVKEVKVGKNTWFAFELFAPLQRTLRLRCTREADAENWVTDLRSLFKVADPIAFNYFFAGSRFHVDPEQMTEKRFTTQLPKQNETCVEPLRRIIVTLKVPPKLFDRLPQPLRDGRTVQLRPVMFSQGINEAQVVADSAAAGTVVNASNEMQEVVNRMGLQLLRQYHNEKLERFKQFQRTFDDENEPRSKYDQQILQRQKKQTIRCANLMENLEHCVLQASESHKTQFEILILAGDVVRALGGFRFTNCMSGKDRTGMSVTLEQARIAVDRHLHGIRDPEFGVFGIRLMQRNSNFFLPDGKFKVQISSIRVLLPKAMRMLGHRRLSVKISVDGVVRVSDASQTMDWNTWTCEFDVVAPIAPTSTISISLNESRNMFSQSASLATADAPLEKVLRDCDVGSEVTLPMSMAAKTPFSKLKDRVRVRFKVLRLCMGRRGVKDIVGGKRVLDIAALMRAHGPRLQNCRKNILKSAYSLRLPARLALPFAYKPPKGTFGDSVEA